MREGWKSVNTNPADYSGHRLLADSYNVLPRHEIARVSELLQSQLLQPLNITPVQPGLGESNLLLVNGLGPQAAGFNEFNPLFLRDELALQAAGLIGDNSTYADEVVQSGIWGNMSYSLGQLHFQTDGFRRNNDLSVDVYDGFVQSSLSPSISVQGEFRHRDTEHGELESLFSPTQQDLTSISRSRKEAHTDSYRAGLSFRPTEASTLIVSTIYQDLASELDRGQATVTGEGYITEAQYLHTQPLVDTIIGGGYYSLDVEETAEGETGQIEASQGNVYLYSYINLFADLTWILGLSVDWLNDTALGEESINPINPKVGMLWHVTSDTTVRLAYFNILKRSLLANQTIEPTNVAGFTQFFDDPNGAQSIRYGVGIDHRLMRDVYVGVELSKRELGVPVLDGDSGMRQALDWKEESYYAYINWTPLSTWAATLEYFREDFDNLESRGPLDTTTQIVPASVSHYSPTGIFARARVSYLDQQVGLERGSASDNATFIDLTLGYRFPKRYGIFEVQLLNLLDKDYRYESGAQRTSQAQDGIPALLPFPPELTVMGRLTLAF